jgi:hypothetical protein
MQPHTTTLWWAKRSTLLSIPRQQLVKILFAALFEDLRGDSWLQELAGSRQQFLDGPVALIDGLVGVGSGGCVRIGNRNSSVSLARDVARALARGPIGIPKRVVLVGVAMRPAVDGDRVDIARRIESPCPEHAFELITNTSLEVFKGSRQEFVVSGALLVASRQPRQAGSTQHPDQYRFFRRVRTLIATDVHGLIEIQRGVIHAGTGCATNT